MTARTRPLLVIAIDNEAAQCGICHDPASWHVDRANEDLYHVAHCETCLARVEESYACREHLAQVCEDVAAMRARTH